MHAATSPPPTSSSAPPVKPTDAPLRKQLKDAAKQAKASGKNKKKKNAHNQTVPGWELTVGIEIHAQLNTAHKLFSPARTPSSSPSSAPLPGTEDGVPGEAAPPNTRVALFDAAMPGAQPLFQRGALIPALRAALALGCEIQRVSRFDRKHYFHWDQPSGYQITQYYEPFARDGRVTLLPRDGIAAEDCGSDGGGDITVGIRQVQMEQDTAKTTAQPGDVHWLDFNRVGVPLIEIITQPEMHHPATAAALVRKVQLLLNAVDACTSGMESGGLRADVNVSVRRVDENGVGSGPLGTRTEIKNLSSFKAVEDAIIAERDRQIAVLEAGGSIEGETRGWSLGATETRRLRGKEGEVDYRYMPDPDLGPVVIGDDLVEHLRGSMGQLPDAETEELIRDYGLSPKDALSLMLLDDGGRIQFFYDVVGALEHRLGSDPGPVGPAGEEDPKRHRILAGNWVLHELGRLTSERNSGPDATNELGMTPEGQCERVPVADLADILAHLHRRRITSRVAKELLFAVYRGDLLAGAEVIGRPGWTVTDAIEEGGLWFSELSDEEYGALADAAVDGEDKLLREFVDFKNYPQGKLMFLVGKMMRLGPEERIDPQSAERVMKKALEEKYVPALRR